MFLQLTDIYNWYSLFLFIRKTTVFLFLVCPHAKKNNLLFYQYPLFFLEKYILQTNTFLSLQLELKNTFKFVTSIVVLSPSYIKNTSLGRGYSYPLSLRSIFNFHLFLILLSFEWIFCV